MERKSNIREFRQRFRLQLGSYRCEESDVAALV